MLHHIHHTRQAYFVVHNLTEFDTVLQDFLKTPHKRDEMMVFLDTQKDMFVKTMKNTKLAQISDTEL